MCERWYTHLASGDVRLTLVELSFFRMLVMV